MSETTDSRRRALRRGDEGGKKEIEQLEAQVSPLKYEESRESTIQTGNGIYPSDGSNWRKIQRTIRYGQKQNANALGEERHLRAV